MNSASASTESLKSWIFGALFAHFDEFASEDGIVVTAEVDTTSISDSEVIGQVTLMLNDKLEDAPKKVAEKLHEALKGAAAEKSTLPILSFTVEGIPDPQPEDDNDQQGGGDQGGGDQNGGLKDEKPEKPEEEHGEKWPKIGKYGEEIWPAEFFSDFEDDEDESKKAHGGRKLSKTP